MNFENRLPEMTALLRKLVETESPSNEKEAVDRVGAILAEASQNLGATVTVYPQKECGDHIVAKWGKGEDGILLLGHMDTVFPLGTLTAMPFYEKDGKLYGPGVQDMKSGLVIGLTAIAELRESGLMPACPVTMLFTSDEEVGSETSQGLIEEFASHSAVVLVLEPSVPDGALKTWRKGVGDFIIRVHGRAAHAGGAHAEGRNALEELSHQILAIQRLTDYAKGTTLNVGVAQGGTALNVVPDYAEAKVDLRVLQMAEYERVRAALNALYPVLDGTKIEVQGELNRPPMPFDVLMETTFKKAQSLAQEIGLELKAGGSGGGSDANFVAPLGIPVLDGLGGIGDGLHSPREYIFKQSLIERSRLLSTLLKEW